MNWRMRVAARFLRRSLSGVAGILALSATVGGIALGVAALVVTLSVMNGFQTEIRRRILAARPHILIQHAYGTQRPEREKVERAREAIGPGFLSGDILYIGQGMLRGGGRSAGVMIQSGDLLGGGEKGGGREGGGEGTPGPTPRTNAPHSLRVPSGVPRLSFADPGQVFLGKELARHLGLAEGAEAALFLAPQDPSEFSQPRAIRVKVAGTVEIGLYEYDSSLVWISPQMSRKIFGPESAAIAIWLKDPMEAAGAGEKLRRVFGWPWIVRPWETLHRSLFAALRLEKTAMFLLLLLITVVAAANVFGTLLALTSQNSTEIGVLRALGAAPGDIRRIVAWQGFLLGAAGAGLGLGIGLCLSALLGRYPIVRLPADIYDISRLPVAVSAGDTAIACGAAILIATLAGLYPAHRAARMDPCQALRRE